MKNKGFTLIELLAVIVILAIIALIATPIILGIINDARERTYLAEAKTVVKTFETSYAAASAKTTPIGNNPTYEELMTEFGVEYGDDITVSGTTATTSDGGVTCTITHDTTANTASLSCTANATGATAEVSKTVPLSPSQQQQP